MTLVSDVISCVWVCWFEVIPLLQHVNCSFIVPHLHAIILVFASARPVMPHVDSLVPLHPMLTMFDAAFVRHSGRSGAS